MSLTSTSPYIVQTQTIPLPYYNDTYKITNTWTNLGPLTTTFHPPADCSTAQLDIFPSTWYSGEYYPAAWPCWEAANTAPAARFSCEPSGAAYSSLVASNYSTFVTWQTYFSPGISCPSGYSTANSITLGPSDISVSAYTVQIPGTHAWCCPSSYTWNQTAFECASQISTAFTTGLCEGVCDISFPSAGCSKPVTYSWSPANTSVTAYAFVPAAYLIHQESDLHKGGLSTGAKIAIGVVVPVVVLTALVCGALVLMRRLKKKREAREGPAPWSAEPLREVQQIE